VGEVVVVSCVAKGQDIIGITSCDLTQVSAGLLE
jgi:hypothetical protein